MFDIAIIGGGPAGLTASIYALRAKKKVLLIEGNTIGGQISSSPRVDNFPGFKSISGFDLANRMEEHAKSAGVEIKYEKVVLIIY